MSEENKTTALLKAIQALARLEIPTKPQGNAGVYSIRHADIQAARDALAEQPHNPIVQVVEWDRTGATEWRGSISYVEWARSDGVAIWLPNMLHPDQISPAANQDGK